MKKLKEYIELLQLINVAQIDIGNGNLSSIEELFSYSSDIEEWYVDINPEFIMYGDYVDLEKEFNKLCKKLKEKYYPKDIDFIEETIFILDDTLEKLESSEIEGNKIEQIRLQNDIGRTSKKLKELVEIWK